jgi:hypothetical protein
MPKMVTKSFGNRNFMQPMGRPKHALKVPCFFSFYVLGQGEGGGGKIYFHFSRLPNKFALCSFQVPNGFPIFSLTFSPYLFTLSHMPWKMVSSFHLYRWAKGEELFKIEPSVLGSIHCLFYLE